MFFEEKQLFPSDGVANYRIPSLVVTKNGTVLAFCTNRVGTLKDYADEIDLVCAVKRPGEDWGQVRVLAHRAAWACNIGSAVYDPHADKTILFFRRTPVARNEFGTYSAEELAEVRESFVGYSTDEAGCAATVKATFKEQESLIDTHTAVGLKCAKQNMSKNRDGLKMVVASTASPYKFASDVYKSITGKAPTDELSALDELKALTGTEIPYPLKDIDKREVRFKTVIDKADMPAEILKNLGIEK